MTTFIATSRGARIFPGRCEEFHRHSDAGPDACEMVSLNRWGWSVWIVLNAIKMKR